MINIDVAIVGAGLSGLSAAFDLSLSGKSVAIIEKEPYLGGRIASFYRKGYVLDSGAVYIVYLGQSMRKLISALPGGFSNLVRVSKRVGFFYDGKLHQLDLSTPFSSMLSLKKFNLLKINVRSLLFLKEIFSHFSKLSSGYSVLSNSPQKSGHVFLSQYFDQKTIKLVFEPISETFLFSDLGNVSESIVKLLLGAFFHPQNNIYHLKSGFGCLASGLGCLLKKRRVKIFTNEKVLKIFREKNSFVIITSKRKLYANSVISSVPFPVLKSLYPEVKLRNIEYLPIISCSIALNSPLLAVDKNHLLFVDSISRRPLLLIGDLIHKNPLLAPQKKGLLYLILGSRDSRRLFHLSDKELENLFDLRLRELFGDEYVRKKVFLKSFRWKHSFPLASADYFSPTSAITNIPGFFVCGDSVHVGVDGVALSGFEASRAAINFQKI